VRKAGYLLEEESNMPVISRFQWLISVETYDIVVSTEPLSFKFRFGGLGAAAGQPCSPFGGPLAVS
jgi:hypothetical protein